MELPDLATLESAARLVHDAMLPTPQIHWPLLSARAGTEVWVKHENHTPVGAFKLRGGLVYLDRLLRAKARPRGLIAATRGNHGQSLAFAAARAGMRTVLVVPRGNSHDKNAAMSAWGAELVEHGDDFQEALEFARRLSEKEQLHFVPSFDDALVAGVGTWALELFRSAPPLDALYVPIGLGSGICGALAAREALRLKTEIIGVTAVAAPAYALSLASDRLIEAPVAATIADGVACRLPDPRALAHIRRGVSRVIEVGEPEIRSAMRHYFTGTHNVAEGAGAAPLAALLQDTQRAQARRVGLVLSGGNVDRRVFAGVLSEP